MYNSGRDRSGMVVDVMSPQETKSLETRVPRVTSVTSARLVHIFRIHTRAFLCVLFDFEALHDA